MVAGVVANVILAWGCLFIEGVGPGVPSMRLAEPIAITRVVAGSAAETAGLRAGDRLLSVGGKALEDELDPLATALATIKASVCDSLLSSINSMMAPDTPCTQKATNVPNTQCYAR